ncbi:unnamed protein product [Microthlaspi erraticum]|uniref:SGNH hydrolase-type esterase domain-containing protein n=1 Tax=Microthlaspi erraticum TaxID=1685480 RepID=A0A6D2IXL1_9BRAS|nr:unnamed protein product [Microthlaspi erraticum]
MHEISGFIKEVVDQTEVNLRRIHALGVKKVGIASLQPLGCLPRVTVVSSFHQCDEAMNAMMNLHNNLLNQVVAKLNNEAKQLTFVYLDYYNAFLSVFKNKGASLGSTRFETPLKPCCEGDCAIVDKKGVKKYTLCKDPKSAFFWNDVHPSQEGWSSVYSVLSKHLSESLIKA